MAGLGTVTTAATKMVMLAMGLTNKFVVVGPKPPIGAGHDASGPNRWPAAAIVSGMP
jgi:hypothetical protein